MLHTDRRVTRSSLREKRAAGVDWTSYLLDNLERIAKKAYRLSSSGENALPASPASSSSAPPSEPSPISPVVHKRAVPPRPQVQVVIPKKTKPVPNVQRKPPTIPKPLSRLRTSQKAAAARKRSSIRRDAVASSQSTGRTSNSRLARCGPVEQYHAYTYIPYLPPDMKPDPPRRDPDDADPRFTDDDKVFFIHYLQWRLHKGAVPKKEALYAELAEQTPHHSAESWKRHWADVPELPDQIYIAARKREKEGGNAKRPPSSEHKRSDDSESESESESEDERSYVESEEESDAQSDQSKGAGENLGQSQSTSPVSAPNPRRQPPKPPKPRMKVPGLKVTEEDLRKMARYMVEKHAVWGQTSSTQGRWREFADRPEVRVLFLSLAMSASC
ncbi:hypothetical protein C8Q74DRAFT_816439 [Fomes fomentarius]|nr:hypothetical protein C8Q74DRAFT_816439 [Fomes fomentarius]